MSAGSGGDALKMARFLIARAGDVSGRPIGNLKLQKLVYYAQGFALALRDRPLFREPLEAWDRGPVVPQVYRMYRGGQRSIEPPADFDAEDYLPEDRELLRAILTTYGKVPGVRLSGWTHAEDPWREAYNVRRNTPLSLPTMKETFSKLVEASRQGRSINGRPVLPIGSFQHQRRQELSDRMEPHRETLRAIARSRPTPAATWSDDEF